MYLQHIIWQHLLSAAAEICAEFLFFIFKLWIFFFSPEDFKSCHEVTLTTASSDLSGCLFRCFSSQIFPQGLKNRCVTAFISLNQKADGYLTRHQSAQKKILKSSWKNFRNANESIARKAITLVLIILLQNFHLYTLTALTRSSVFYLRASDTEHNACVFNPKWKVHLEHARQGINWF